ncbi:hypothetical protein GCM10011510_16440 [Streptococcus himalayensis]|uniref:Uncharacterized protein n=1 Tax=Streptococcus himalayensis TaxID=1888195 RepID=A0A917A9Y5_9STRE|nr:hypothetical protein GCM10011510_16440 [Streptococcus himalayensis]
MKSTGIKNSSFAFEPSKQVAKMLTLMLDEYYISKIEYALLSLRKRVKPNVPRTSGLTLLLLNYQTATLQI